MKITELKHAVQEGQVDEKLKALYGEENLDSQKARYGRILDRACKLFGDEEGHLFSAPGRSEIGGNHTDHQLGRVIGASINLDLVAVVVPTDNNIVTYKSEGFEVKPVDLNDLSIRTEEKNTTESLIRGTAAGLVEKGYTVGGFNCYAESDVLPGSGLSSSAAFEVLIGTIFSGLYNENAITSEEIAKNGQYAENIYFMKSSGLLDQMSCAIGAFAAMDFKDPENPIVEKIDFNPAEYGYDLIVTDIKADHSDLSDEYSLVPQDMKDVAKLLGHNVLSECTMSDLLSHTARIRNNCGDRAYLRAYHFLRETERAVDQKKALQAKDFKKFLELVKESGRSSWMYLQNVCVPGSTKSQPVAIGLAISDEILGEEGAWRVHGGGFAGTIQAYVPQSKTAAYINQMEQVFGEGCCYKLRIRAFGGIEIL